MYLYCSLAFIYAYYWISLRVCRSLWMPLDELCLHCWEANSVGSINSHTTLETRKVDFAICVGVASSTDGY